MHAVLALVVGVLDAEESICMTKEWMCAVLVFIQLLTNTVLQLCVIPECTGFSARLQETELDLRT
jgi:hypothetical protein